MEEVCVCEWGGGGGYLSPHDTDTIYFLILSAVCSHIIFPCIIS